MTRSIAAAFAVVGAIFLSLPSWALDLQGSFAQGGLVVGRAEPGATVTLDGKRIRVGDDGRFLIGFGRDAKPSAELIVAAAAGTELRALKIARRAYDVQRIDGLPPKQVTPDPQTLKRIAAERDLIAAARRRDTEASMFAAGFQWPARGRISGVYGSQRILNGTPRSPHLGVDIAAPVGTDVVATTDGIVALADDDLFFTGKTVSLDHGHGLTSVSAHLSETAVKAGERVKKGQAIGRIGATGRVTGPHLHWGVHWHGVGLDPALLVGDMPKGAAAR